MAISTHHSFSCYKAQSFLALHFQHLLNHPILASININCLRNVSALLNDELDLLLCGCAKDFALVGINDALDRLIVAITSIVGTGGDVVRLVLSRLLGCTGGLDAMQVLLVEPAIIIDAVFPVVLLEVEVVIEDVLATGHLAIDPLRLVVAALRDWGSTLG